MSLSIVYYRAGIPLDNGKESGGAAGGDGEGWKAILRKRREKIIKTRGEGNIEEKKYLLRLGWTVDKAPRLTIRHQKSHLDLCF